jgi:hypothetical protein
MAGYTPDVQHGNRQADWKPIRGSSCVEQIAWWYDEARRIGVLAVTFKPKPRRPWHRVWWYEDVPKTVYSNMLRASSRGRFVWGELRDKYVSYEVSS